MLDDRDQATLALERLWFRAKGVKVARIADEFGETETAYYRRLNALIDRPEALAADPVTVGRLRRLREMRRGMRRAG